MKEEKNESISNAMENVEVATSKVELFIEKNQAKIGYMVGAAIAIVLMLLAVRQYYVIPKEKKAQVELFRGEFYFLNDSIHSALYGDGRDFIGFEGVIKKYGLTSSGNLAKAYAGLCYKKMGEYQKAIDHLKGYKASDPLVAPSIIGSIGDCYVELGKVKEAIPYFEKAAHQAKNDLISPMFLKKAGIACENLKEYKKALKYYTEIKEKYYTSQDAADIDKYITRVEEAKK